MTNILVILISAVLAWPRTRLDHTRLRFPCSRNLLVWRRQLFHCQIKVVGNDMIANFSLLRGLRTRCQRRNRIKGLRSDVTGFVLPTVCIVILFLTFQAYVFTELMLVENIASVAAGKSRVAMSLSDSGIEYVASKITADQKGPAYAFNLDEWHGSMLSKRGRNYGEFEIFCRRGFGSQWASGVSDEARKLNLNELPRDMEHALEARRMLLCFPLVTPRLADAILDWIDEDEEPRPFGAESSYYSSLSGNGGARNQPLNHLDDLLGVRGMTRKILYGADERSGWTGKPMSVGTENELAGRITQPSSNRKDLCLEDFWTVYGGESFFTPKGERKILVNNPDLALLFDNLARKYGEEVATYVVAYRLYGPLDKSSLPADNFLVDEAEETRRRGERQSGSQENGLSVLTPDSDVTRGVLKIGSEGDFQIRSVYDLIGVPVLLPKENNFQKLSSPWKSTADAYREVVPDLQAGFSFYNATPINVKVNVNLAPVEVLNAIPGMEDGLAARVVKMRSRLGQGSTDARSPRNARVSFSIDWLRSEGVMTMEQLRTYAPYLTVRGNAFRFISRGRSLPSGQVFSQQIVLDAREFPAQVAFSLPESRRIFGAE